jgi:hypothetical protein
MKRVDFVIEVRKRVKKKEGVELEEIYLISLRKKKMFQLFFVI